MSKFGIHPQRNNWTVALIALLLPIGALILQLQLWSVVQPYLWLFFYPAVFFSAHFAGFRGGMLSTLLSIGLANFFFMEPTRSLAVSNWGQVAVLAMFFTMGVLISLVHHKYHRTRTRFNQALRQSADAAEHYRAMFETAEGPAFSFPNQTPIPDQLASNALPQFIPER